MSLDEAIISAVMASAFDPCIYATPLKDEAGQVCDLRIDHLNTQAAEWLAIPAERGESLQLRRDFPDYLPPSVWMICLHVLDSGEHKEWHYHQEDHPEQAAWMVRLVRLQQGLLLCFRRQEIQPASLQLEQQLQKIFSEEAAEGMLDWDLRTGTARYSERFKAMLGLGGAAIPQVIQVFFNALSPAEAEPVQQLIWEAINGGAATLEHHTRFLHQNGALRTLWCSGRILRNAEGEALRVVYVFRDETREASLLDELHRQQELLQLFLDASQDGFFEWNPRSGQIYFSSRWKSFLGYAPAQLENHWRAWTQMLTPNSAHWPEELAAAAAQDQLPAQPVLLELKHRQGHTVKLLLRLSAKRLPEGSLLRILGVATNLSQIPGAPAGSLP